MVEIIFPSRNNSYNVTFATRRMETLSWLAVFQMNRKNARHLGLPFGIVSETLATRII